MEDDEDDYGDGDLQIRTKHGRATAFVLRATTMTTMKRVTESTTVNLQVMR